MSLHFSAGNNSEQNNLKQNYTHCAYEISKQFTVNNMNKTGFKKLKYDFSVSSDTIDINDIDEIHKYLIKKNTTLHICVDSFYNSNVGDVRFWWFIGHEMYIPE